MKYTGELSWALWSSAMASHSRAVVPNLYYTAPAAQLWETWSYTPGLDRALQRAKHC